MINRKSNSGLTLVELMMVIAIIGILASIAIPGYANYTEKARVSQAVSDIATIAVKAEAYFLDNGEYPETLADARLEQIDPWDNPYQYLNLYDKNGKGGNRKDKNLNPLNSDFDLYSMGKNGVTKTQISNKDSLDDVIRANDGKFIDLAEKY